MDLNKIYLEDCIEGMSKIPSSSIDLIITSPPYKDSDNFSIRLMIECFSELYRIQKPNSLFFLNFGSLAEEKLRPFKVAAAAEFCGYQTNDVITWVKNHYRPIQGNKRLNNLTEFIFILYKGEMPDLDRLSIGIPYKDKSNVKRFAGGKDLKCGGNVWYIDYETINSKKEKLHNDRFPLELPIKCIKLSGLKNGTILDPFSGSGTTCLAAKRLGFSYIGFEKNEENHRISCHRIDEDTKLG